MSPLARFCTNRSIKNLRVALNPAMETVRCPQSICGEHGKNDRGTVATAPASGITACVLWWPWLSVRMSWEWGELVPLHKTAPCIGGTADRLQPTREVVARILQLLQKLGTMLSSP